PKQPKALVRSLYTEVVARHPLGISVGGQLKIFSPYLSKALLHKIQVANACLDDWYRQNPDPNSKPPGLEGGLFTGDEAEPSSFEVERLESKRDGSIRVYVKLTHGQPGENLWTWHIAAVLVREDRNF